ncbi:MAG TPA: serine hydrolase domain-containing protein, partial [Emcibacteraceae bacterium]|nr:serine hydrolase domain-containing protein [Emcibacteraceae bacterium]
MAKKSGNQKLKMVRSFTCYFLFCIIFSLNAVWAQEHPEIDREMNEALINIVAHSVPGISVAVANKNGVIWSGAAGFSNIDDGVTLSQSHLLGIGDITNQFIGTILLQMEQEGVVNLNATPKSILGDVVANIENADTASLYQLLNNTSGIYSWSDDEDWARRGRGIQLNPHYQWRRDEVLQYITKDLHQALSIPGEMRHYSKSNYTILGLIIEKITGGPLELEVRNRILAPLKLTHTYYDTYEILPQGGLAGSYHLGTNQFISKVGINADFETESNLFINTSGTSLSSEGLAGGMVTTPRELAIFASALWNGKIINEKDLTTILPEKINGHTGIHSEILGFTADIRKIENSDIIIVSMINLGAVNSGKSPMKDYLDSYMDKILIPIAKKYAP